MRIHLSLDAAHLHPPRSIAGPSSSPIVQIGGDLVLIELQGELSWEGDKADGVVGVLGLERPDRPTLHLGQHHLLHGKMASLAKPYAVIQRAAGDAVDAEVDEEDEEEEEDEKEDGPSTRQLYGHTNGKRLQEEVDADEPPLFDPEPNVFGTPTRHPPTSSSPILPPSSAPDYSSELDLSSPARFNVDDFGMKRDHGDVTDEENELFETEHRAKRARRKDRREEDGGRKRTRRYEVVGVVRKKVVFGLR